MSRRTPRRAARRAPAAIRPALEVESLESRLLLATYAAGNGRAIYLFSGPDDVRPAQLYPSIATVRDLPGTVSNVRVTISGFTHSAPGDVDILLVSPSNKGVLLMSDAGGTHSIADPGIDISFDDAATRSLPQDAEIQPGTYRPTNYDNAEQGAQPFPANAPRPPYATTLSAFNGEDPTPEPDGTGQWKLYVVDDGPFGDDGAINFGWTITVTTGGPGPIAPSAPDMQPFSDTGASQEDNVTKITNPIFEGTATAGTEVRLFANGLQIGSSPITNGTYSIEANLIPGTYSVVARAVNAEGNEGAASPEVMVVIDNEAPDFPSAPDLTPGSDTGPSNTDDITSDTTPTFTGSAPGASTLTLVADGRAIGSGPVAADGTYNVTVANPLALGPHDVYASAVDLAGNVSSLSDPLTITIEQGPIGDPPHVTQVFVNGPGLTAGSGPNNVAFRNLAGVDTTFGYAVPAGANQLKAIPWNGGVNQLAVRFDTDVQGQVGQDDLHVVGAANGAYGFTNFNYDPGTKTALWTLSSTVTNDKIRLTIPSASLLNLDGEWTDNADAYPSGNGIAGGDFAFRIYVLRGDATQDGRVNALDLSFVRSKLNKTATNPGSGTTAYSPFADINPDGQINALDLSAVRNRLNTSLPSGEPAATALLFSPRPISA